MKKYFLYILIPIIAILAIIFFQKHNKVTLYDIHKKYNISFSGKKQVINVLDVNLDKYIVKPILSDNNLLGFEKTSRMARDNKAYAAVNGTFMDELGMPLGIVLIDDKLITNQSQGNPIFYITKQKNVYIDDSIKFLVSLRANKDTIRVDTLNNPIKDNQMAVFNKDFGYNNRYIGEAYNVIINNDKIIKSFYSTDIVDIPQTGFLISATGNKIEKLKKLNGEIKLEYLNSKNLNLNQAIECGSWIIKNKQKAIKTYDNWIGNTTTQEPRSIIATKNNHVLLITVDGKQIPYSSGFNCYELYEYLKDLDVDNACYLDGGGSTTMWLDGKIINNPSFLGRERDVSNAIGVFIH